MKSLNKILIFIALLIGSVTFGQTPNNCDTIYNFVEDMPKFDKDIEGLRDYLNKDLIPIIGECMSQDSSLIASLRIILTIDKNGQVIDATFPKPEMTDQCKSDLKEKLLTMTGWKPGKINEQNVCTHFRWPISCIKWE